MKKRRGLHAKCGGQKASEGFRSCWMCRELEEHHEDGRVQPKQQEQRFESPTIGAQPLTANHSDRDSSSLAEHGVTRGGLEEEPFPGNQEKKKASREPDQRLEVCLAAL
ncbi:hypothetical protein EYF80_034399 [Liparis tanakae]|uniref:Uncharacterized protein n=1 Tax=Liparis tanakae TaxID=230148 RepID=A0A4Z2GPA9_9TELE|nr:hypothetical protein EYF80_034399 [Liparis tanakae]